jgi:hypothetical protein
VPLGEACQDRDQGLGLGLVAFEQVHSQREPGPGGQQPDGDLGVDAAFLAHPDLAEPIFDIGLEVQRAPFALHHDDEVIGVADQTVGRLTVVAALGPLVGRPHRLVPLLGEMIIRMDRAMLASSGDRVFTFFSRSGWPTRASASVSIAVQAVCQSTPRCRASADTVVSSWLSASVAQRTARVDSSARGGANLDVSLDVAVGHIGSRQRQIRFNHRTTVTRAKHGASCTTWTRRP